MASTSMLVHIVRVACAVALLCGLPARGFALQAEDEGACAEAQRCLDLLQDGIDFIEAGRWEAASLVLEEVAAGLEGRPLHVRDLARALVHLGVARLQIADANETRQLFAEAQVRDPTLQLDPAEVSEGRTRDLGGSGSAWACSSSRASRRARRYWWMAPSGVARRSA